MMDTHEKISTHTGYHWREELANRLLPYVKDGVDRRFLNNILREYVPTFFPTSLPNGGDANWLFVLSLGSGGHWWRQEIEKIGNELAQVSVLDDKFVKRIFKKHYWKVDEPVEGISMSDRRGKWKYDAYKDRIAVEVELSSRSQIFKDSFKFLIGQAMSQIDVGVIMVRKNLAPGKPYFGSVQRDWHPIYTTLPMLNIAFYGF